MLDAMPVVGVCDVSAVPSQKKINAMNTGARDVKGIVSRPLRNDAVLKEMLRDFDNWLADYE